MLLKYSEDSGFHLTYAKTTEYAYEFFQQKNKNSFFFLKHHHHYHPTPSELCGYFAQQMKTRKHEKLEIGFWHL